MLIVRRVGLGVVPYLVDGRHPGRWSPGAARLLGLAGAIDAGHLRQVLDGQDPGSGLDLPLMRRRDRRPGWGLVFSAPKSVSLLAAVDANVAQAHVAAVDGVLDYLDSRLRLNRMDADHSLLHADGLVAASFDHTTNAGSEPHLHTHVVVANMSRSGDKWGTLHSADWYSDRAALSALFELGLRHQLGERGWPLDWRLRPDGLSDLADVPRAVVRAASFQGRRANSAGRFAARASATPQPWEERTADAGFVTPTQPDGDGRRHQPGMDDPGLERSVSLRLTSRRSDFRRADVIETLASCWPGGASVAAATTWADNFCGKSTPVPSPTSQPRWTTTASRRLDDELVRELTERPVARVAGLAEVATSAEGVLFMGSDAGRSALLAQAEAIAMAGVAWEAAGLRVAVSASDPVGEIRWSVLTGLRAFRPGDRADVLVVDQADRRPTADLIRLARAHEGDLIFVEGGTLPRLTNPASHGLVEAADRLGRVTSGPCQPWGSPAGPDPGSSRLIGRQAADALLHEWRGAGDDSVMVALGIEEMRGLNRAALGSDRPARGPDRFQPGDRVVVFRSGAGLPSFGTFGVVGDRTNRSVGFDWATGDRTVTSDHRTLASIDFGYAVSARLGASIDRPLRVLGPAAALSRGRGLERVISALEVPSVGPGWDRSLDVS